MGDSGQVSFPKIISARSGDENYHLFARSYGSFSPTLELPGGTDPNAIKASIWNGVLKVTVPKPAPAQVKKVQVKAAA